MHGPRIMRYKLHPSWLIAGFALASILGIALAAGGPLVRADVWQLLTITLALMVIVFMNRTLAALLLAIIAGLLAGAWRGSVEQYGLQAYEPLYGKAITLSGVVSDDTSYGPHGDQRIMLKDITVDRQPLPGQVWISTDSANTIKRSDHVTVAGKLGTGFGSIAASMFYARLTQMKRPNPGDIGLRIRDWFASGIRLAIPEPEASLAAGYLVGQRSALPEELDQQLKTVGLTHAVVASGYNLTILVSFARQLLLGISKYLATLSAAAMIAGFMMISGLSPSMSRAGLVTGLGLAAWYYGRRIHPAVLLAIAGAATALIRPAYIWGDIGWYLSFASFAGVIILAPLVQHYFWGNKKRSFIHALIVDTMSAQAATLPIMLFAFGHYSPYALVANLLVLPLIPLTMALTFIAGLSGLILPAAAHVFGLPATIILRYMTTVVSHIADLPGAQGDLTINIAILGTSYILLAIIAGAFWRKTRHNFRLEPEQTSEPE